MRCIRRFEIVCVDEIRYFGLLSGVYDVANKV